MKKLVSIALSLVILVTSIVTPILSQTALAAANNYGGLGYIVNCYSRTTTPLVFGAGNYLTSPNGKYRFSITSTGTLTMGYDSNGSTGGYNYSTVGLGGSAGLVANATNHKFSLSTTSFKITSRSNNANEFNKPTPAGWILHSLTLEDTGILYLQYATIGKTSGSRPLITYNIVNKLEICRASSR